MIFMLTGLVVAILHPFPVRNWREALWCDIALYGGIGASGMAMVGAYMVVLAVSDKARTRLHHSGAKVTIGVVMFAACSAWFLAFVVNDVRDLRSAPLVAVDVVRDTAAGPEGDQRTVTFATVGELRLAHGLPFDEIEYGRAYSIEYTPYGRMLVGMKPSQE